jgi:hypothetical protein
MFVDICLWGQPFGRDRRLRVTFDPEGSVGSPSPQMPEEGRERENKEEK